MNKDSKLNILLLISSVVITFVIIITGRFVQETYNLKVGQVAPKTVYAPREMQNKTATQHKKEQMENSIESQYVVDPTVEEEARQAVELLFDYVQAVQLDEVTQYDADPIEILKARSTIPLYTEQYQLLLELSNDELIALKNQILDTVETIYTEGITAETQAKITIGIKGIFEKTKLNLTQSKLGHEIVSLLIRPNMIVDSNATEALIEETVSKIEPVMILAGEKIIEQGTRITEETYQLLKDAGYMEEEASNSIKRSMGVIIIVVLVAGILYGYMSKKKKDLQLNSKEKTLLFVLYIIAILTLRALAGIGFVYIPMTIVPMLVAILIDSDIAIILNMILVAIGALIYKGDITYILYFIITGTISAISVINVRERNKTLAIATYMGLINVLVIVALRLFTQGTVGMELITEGIGAFLIGILMLIIVIGSLPFWEIAFDIVTPIKLLELTNPNQELLKRLLLEATGTYYHSLLVANLAETAANDIGANSLLARVGGYYHDIGKLGYVNYYKENQIAENPHDYLEPELSGQIILSHVSRGEELAAQYKLPKSVKDIIVQHHGNTLVQYFYMKAREIQSEEEVRKEDYQYRGPKPQSKEAAIVMLADVVEATVRSMMPVKNKEDELEKIVAKIVRQKLDDGQLDESKLMIQDIEKIIGAFNRLLVGMYHDRITYPTQEEGAKV